MLGFGDDLSTPLGEPVGNNMHNRPDDVLRVKKALGSIGRFVNDPAPEDGILTRDLDRSIKAFQRDNGLKIDGIIRPGGETERAISGKIDEKRQKQADSLRNLMKKNRLIEHDDVARLSDPRPLEMLSSDKEDEPPAEKEPPPQKDKPPADDKKPEESPPEKDKEPEEDPPEDSEEADCSDLEVALANAQSILRGKENAVSLVKEKIVSLETEEKKLQDDISQKKAEFNFLANKIRGMAAATGAIGGALAGIVVGKNLNFARGGALTGGKTSLELAEAALSRLQGEAGLLKKKKEEISNILEPLRAEMVQLQESAVEVQALVNAAQAALNSCKDR